MSNLGNFLAAQIEKDGGTSRDMAARLGLDPSQLSGFVSGNRPSCNTSTLAKMVEGISDDPTVRCKLLEAYFRDQTAPEMRDWIHVDPHASTAATVLRETTGTYRTGFTPPPEDPLDQLIAVLRELAIPTAIIRALTIVIRAVPDHTALGDLLRELGEFTNDALGANPPPRAKNARKRN